MRRFSVVALALAVIAAAGPLSAQTGQRYSVQGSLIFTGLFGKAFDEIKDGGGGELQFRVTPGAFSMGGGLQFTKHDPDGEASEFFESISLTGVFLEPRYVLPRGGPNYAPYLSGRFALSKMTFTLAPGVESPTIRVTIEEPTGPTINVGGGVLFVLSSRVNLDVGATFGYTQFKDITVTARNTSTGQEASGTVNIGNGTNTVVRLGLAIGLGQ